MKNNTLASLGIGAYVLAVLSSATDWQGKFIAPTPLILVSGIAAVAFLMSATFRLWHQARAVSIALASSTLLLVFLSIEANATPHPEGSLIAIVTTVTKLANLGAFVWTIVTLFKIGAPRVDCEADTTISPAALESQRDMARRIFSGNRALAMRIAMGEEKELDGSILAATVYATVCENAELSSDLETCVQLANSWHNEDISATARRVKLRDPEAPIEAMKKVARLRRAAFERTLPKGKTLADVVDAETASMERAISDVGMPNAEAVAKIIMDARANSDE